MRIFNLFRQNVDAARVKQTTNKLEIMLKNIRRKQKNTMPTLTSMTASKRTLESSLLCLKIREMFDFQMSNMIKVWRVKYGSFSLPNSAAVKLWDIQSINIKMKLDLQRRIEYIYHVHLNQQMFIGRIQESLLVRDSLPFW